MNRKVLTGLLAAVVLVFLAAYLASPLLAVRTLVSAARDGDAARLERVVDFPAFRLSLKEELNAQLIAHMRAELGARGAALGGLGMILAPTLISGAVDAFVTPPAIAAMVTNAQAPGAEDLARRRAPRADDPAREIRRSYRYRSLDVFVVRLTRADRPTQPIDLLMERRGLFAWKLAGIDLPDVVGR